MPPPGGYRPIVWEKIPAKTICTAPRLFGGLAISTMIGAIGYYFTFNKMQALGLEEVDARIAIEPILQAERDREFLKQIKKNIAAEKELMKNVPGWEEGTCYGEPIYKTVEYDPVFHQSLYEYYVHSRPYAYYYRHWIRFRQ